MVKELLLSSIMLLTTISVSAQKRTVSATVYKQFKSSIVTLSNGHVTRQSLTNIFLKNSSLLYIQGEYTMEADMNNIATVEFDDRKYININNQLAYLVDTIGDNRLYRINILDLDSYKAQLRNNVNVSNFEIGDFVNINTVDTNNEEDYKFPIIPVFYYLYNGEFIKVHEREISRKLPKDKDIKRKYKTIIGLSTFSWTDEASLMQLLKAISPDSNNQEQSQSQDENSEPQQDKNPNDHEGS